MPKHCPNIKSQVLSGLIIILVFNLLAFTHAKAQDIRFWHSSETEHFASDQFLTDLFRDDKQGSIRIGEGEIYFGDGSAMISGFDQASISEDRAFVGVLFIRGNQVSAEIYRSDGTLLHHIAHLAEYDPDDPSVRLFMLSDGSFVYRDNIASFTYYDERGEQVFRIFNSSGSPDGEAVSQFTATPFGNRMLAYNPRIFVGEKVGSRIQHVGFDEKTTVLAQFERLSILSVRMHRSGNLLLVHSHDESADRHHAQVISIRGDVLVEIDYDDNEIEGVALSDCGRYVTGMATGRAMVHDVTSGERLGSASFRERILTASYMPDGNLAVLTGTRRGRELRELRMHIIDIRQQRVVREETALTVHTSDYFLLSLTYDGDATYRLLGVNRELIIRHTL